MTGPRPLAAWLVLAVTAAAPAADPVPPKTVTLKAGTLGGALAELTRQTGIPIDSTLDPKTPCPVTVSDVPFWTALEQLADKVGGRITLADQGRRPGLAKRAGPKTPSSVAGAFRVAVKQVQPKIDFETGKTFTEVTLDVHWEPRFPVFRIDSQPTITTATSDAGKATPQTSKSRTPPVGSVYTATVRLEGVPRSAKSITRLAGSFTVTAAPKMLQFEFKDLTANRPVSAEKEGVTATLKPVQKVGDRWEVELEVSYPPLPEFESFESWVTENRLQLVSPAGKAFETTDYDFPEQGRKLVAVYRFPAGVPLGDRKGWSAVYRTPAPLVEFPVRFDLRDIPLP